MSRLASGNCVARSKPEVAVSALLLCILLVVFACAPAASPPAPSPIPATPTSSPAKATTAPAPTPVPPAKPTAGPATKAPPAALTQLIEGAKKEAKVSTTLTDNLTEQGVQRLRKEIKEKFGVDLEIQFEPVGSYSARLPQAIAQYKAEVTPTFDLMQSNDLLIRRYIDAAVIEKPDWGPLLAEGTPREVIMWDGYALSTQTSHIGMIFDPKVVPPADAPKSLSDLANPRWRGKFIGLSAPSSYVSYAFVRGVDRTLSDLRAMIKNEPVIETYARALTRYSAGEYPIAMISSNYHENARQQGVSVEWRSLDMSYLSVIGVMVLKRAAHPNAAKLVAAYLASPAGHKLILEEAKNGSALHPGNPEFEKHQQDVKAGLPLFNPTQWPGAADFLLSEKGQQLEKEIAEILKGG